MSRNYQRDCETPNAIQNRNSLHVPLIGTYPYFILG